MTPLILGVAEASNGAIWNIDLTSPSLGTEFTDGGPDTTTVVIIGVRSMAQANDAATGLTPVLSPSGAANALASSDTMTVTIGGVFTGIASAFLASDSTCTQPMSTGTVTASAITLPGVPLDSSFLFPCVTADGHTLLPLNPPHPDPSNPFTAFTVAVSPGTSTDFLGTSASAGTSDNLTLAGVWTYTGGGVVEVTNFFTGDDAGYSSLLRVNNAGTAAADLFAVVQPDTGGPPLTGLIGTLGPGMGTVFTEAQIQANVPGLTLANSGQRATLQLIFGGGTRNNVPVVSASGLLVNPTGAVTAMPSPVSPSR